MPLRERKGDISINGRHYAIARSSDKPGLRLWHSFNISTQSARHTEADAKYSVAAPEIQIPFSWEDWSGGYGDNEFVRSNGYVVSAGIDTSTPAQLMPAARVQTVTLNASLAAYASGLPVNGVTWDYQDNFHVALGSRLFRLNASLAVTEFATTFGTYGFANDAALFGTYSYLAVYGSGYVQNAMWQMNQSGSLTQATTTLPAVGLSVVQERLWRGFIGTASGRSDEQAWVVSNVAFGSDPMTFANWSANYAVGESSAPITKIVDYLGLTTVAKTDGLYFYESDTNRFKNVLSEMKLRPHRDNGIATAVWAGYAFYNDQDSLWAVRIEGDPGVPIVYNATPGFGRQNDTLVRGPVLSLCPAGATMFATIYNAAVSEFFVLNCREGREGEERFVWNISLTQNSGSQATAQRRHLGLTRVSGDANLFTIARDNGASSTVQRYLVALGNANPTRTPNYIWEQAFNDIQDEIPLTLTLPRHYMGAPATAKVGRTVTLQVDPRIFGTGILGVSYRWDGTGSYLTLGSMGATDAPQRSFNFTNNVGYGLDLLLRMIRGNASQAPVVTKIWGLATARPLNIRGYEAHIRLVDHPSYNDGTRDNRQADQIEADLYNLRATGPVTLVDPLGVSRQVLMMNNIEEFEMMEWGENRNPEWVAKVTMIEWP